MALSRFASSCAECLASGGVFVLPRESPAKRCERGHLARGMAEQLDKPNAQRMRAKARA